jgi:hypothetical protein
MAGYVEELRHIFLQNSMKSAAPIAAIKEFRGKTR